MKFIATLSLLIIFYFTGFSQKQKVIFDCDLGGDIDDAFAVALLLTSQEEFDIMGLCMDHGNTPGRGQVALKMLHETGLDHIPVYLGRHTATVVGQDTELEGDAHQFMWAEGFNALKPNPLPAADFIIETLNKYPGEVILFTVGPVDNIADVVDKDPEALKKAKKVVSMFGSVYKGYGGGAISAEWNVRGSIEAAKKFMQSGADITLAPLGITDHVIMENDRLTAIFNRQTPLTDALGALYALWYRHADWALQAKMFDGVAIGMVLWPKLFETEKAHVYVDDKGYTRIDQQKPPNCTVGIAIDKDEFLNLMMRRIIEQNYQTK
ncbi:MAG: nucleoside hydrolase [Candidatus Cyclobacteriaceae bacterium M3_2C_046]